MPIGAQAPNPKPQTLTPKPLTLHVRFLPTLYTACCTRCCWLQIYPGMHVLLSETIDAQLGVVKGAIGVLVDYVHVLHIRGSPNDKITVMILHHDNVHGICTVHHSKRLLSCGHSGWHNLVGACPLWKKSFPLKCLHM